MNFVLSSTLDLTEENPEGWFLQLKTFHSLVSFDARFQAMQPIVNDVRFACSLFKGRLKNIFSHSGEFHIALQLVFYDRYLCNIDDKFQNICKIFFRYFQILFNLISSYC